MNEEDHEEDQGSVERRWTECPHRFSSQFDTVFVVILYSFIFVYLYITRRVV